MVNPSWPVRVFVGLSWRLVHRNRLLILTAPPESSRPIDPPGLTRVRIGSRASTTHIALAEEAMRTADEPPGLVAPRLSRGHELFGWMNGRAIASFGWVSYRDRLVGPVPLKDASARVFLYNFCTMDEYRGRGLYPTLLRVMRWELGCDGAKEFVIDVNFRNVASRRGIEKAGFAPVAEVTYLTVLNHWKLLANRRQNARCGLF